MEEERQSKEESSHLCTPIQFFIKSFLKCLGLHISSSPSEAPNGVVTTRGMILRSKQRDGESPSSGRPGRRN
ncbi:unnamed protein product [Eruca vesicaria subsp. sativa]|uniref:Uncharacterized protein n=1 Tax=Eruca vesicaria subsp. sativa TaxID=29727 RepID=A0ABC8IUY3_ERUVS|nr:unnamed protein product [Eruca vesicaria subsp. sativa]